MNLRLIAITQGQAGLDAYWKAQPEPEPVTARFYAVDEPDMIYWSGTNTQDANTWSDYEIMRRAAMRDAQHQLEREQARQRIQRGLNAAYGVGLDYSNALNRQAMTATQVANEQASQQRPWWRRGVDTLFGDR